MEQRLYDAAAKLPATDAKLDTSQMTGKIRATNSIGRVVITLAACAAAMCMILFGALSLAGEVREYNVAVSYFTEHGFSTEGLSRRDIKDVYKDIVNGTFTHPKTESVLNSIRSTEPQPTGETEYEQLRGQYFDEQKTHRPTEEEVLQVKERMPMKEVVELIGKPHDFGPTSGFLTLQWELADGQLFVVYVAIPSIVPDNMEFLTQIFEYGYIFNPGIWTWASPDPTAPTDPTDPTDPITTDPEAELLAQYFDLEKTHRPTLDEVLSIQEGTSVQDAVALLGKPHGFAPSHNWATFWWETAEGHAVLVDLRSTKYFPIDGGIPSAVENYFKYCVVDWVVPLVEMDTPLDNIGEAYDEAALYNAVNRYFYQREAYLLGQASTIDNVVPGITKDEDAHKAAIAAAGIERLSSDVVIHGIAYWDSHAQVVATETVTYRENGVEKTAAILHRLQLSGENDEGKISTGADMYFEAITGFCSSSYLPPWYETPQPNLTEPYDPNNPTDPTDPTDPSEPTEPYPEPSFEDPVTLTWCIPDSNGMYSYPELDRIIAAINEITQREINTTIKLEVIPVGDYTEAMSMKYVAAERWDICFSGMWNNYKDAVMQGAFVELPVDMLRAYAPDLMETLDPAALEALKIQGEVYALPVQWLHAQQSGLLFDTELAEKLGFDWRSVKKLEDLEPYFDMLLANGYTECISLDPWEMMNYLQSYFGFDYLYSHLIPAAVRVSDQNGTVINPYETEEFKAFARLIYKWYNKGYFTDEILSGSTKSRPVTLYPITGSGEQWQFGFAGQMVPLGQAVMTTEQVQSATLAISCYCKNPERAVAFINLLTTNEELLNLVTYGQEGIDWNWVDEDDKVIQREEYAYPGTYAMMVGNDCLDYYLDPQLVGGNETIREINADARTSAILGFQYDASKTAGYMANIQVAADGLIRSIVCGMAGDPDVAIAKLNADLYAAGLQQVLDDMQSQVDAWKASQ